MKRLSLTLTAVALLAGPALAQETVVVNTMPVVVDSDGDGRYTVEDLRVVWVELSDDDYKVIDVDADGFVSEDELKSAWEQQSVLKENKNGNADEKKDGEAGNAG
ncbi:hypothetical protein Q9295_10865 [Xinfangfangia sp. CPCC 101601]|uniref:EF-hand domain-containing protein n=1 Tax=Pseudogemmobacter lacusdianii TaxID=3069608 RepID=A0ABU0VYP6_9RHOB|nr:hypothetical protein [Xinfangfangia sp. CPCC 101601]MDQ2066877.1 hypothetical protein [Xinfangfangia sp. CPCC 101601]